MTCIACIVTPTIYSEFITSPAAWLCFITLNTPLPTRLRVSLIFCPQETCRTILARKTPSLYFLCFSAGPCSLHLWLAAGSITLVRHPEIMWLSNNRITRTISCRKETLGARELKNDEVGQLDLAWLESWSETQLSLDESSSSASLHNLFVGAQLYT